ncbi:DUF3153 domain-containing protein [Roseofilum casamattae]|uniref:DUF3153 domain-containing protein n=1 Tax=Roseofilum casamattae BLCC-M143 TaxID=3022442 RepID=A0ABT7C188_9CYAN|nr:DUF3153 domain-containing protein [Roseofilum casamattae]MDJ1185199.1 DUF3153 domain-containing protein [Roseofilum casamattae BLCC-M143]
MGKQARQHVPIMGKHQSILRVLLPLYVLVAIALTGCVNYDIGVDFRSQNYGEMVQHIALSDSLQDFNQEVAEQWVQNLEQRTRQLRGRTKRVSDREIFVTIPFSNADELTSKFDRFFNPTNTLGTETDSGLPKLTSELTIAQNNFWIAVRNRLQVDVDLRSLAVVSEEGEVLLAPGSLLDLKFGLTTPWGAKVVSPDETSPAPEVNEETHQLTWTLKAGDSHHLEVIFWLPSPVGIGALIIIAAVLGGMYLKDLIPAQSR